VNPERLESFLDMLPRRHRYAFEMRNSAWHIQPIYDLLHRYNAAFCIYELASFQSPIEITADFTYVRLHGPDGPYQGSYSSAALDTWARRICEWRAELKSVYIYFDNDQEAFAARNALDLKNKLEQASACL